MFKLAHLVRLTIPIAIFRQGLTNMNDGTETNCVTISLYARTINPILCHCLLLSVIIQMK